MTTLFERTWHRIVPLDNPAGVIYGTVITASLIAGQSDEPIGVIIASVVVTLVVFWLAHVYADVLAHDADGRRPSPCGESCTPWAANGRSWRRHSHRWRCC